MFDIVEQIWLNPKLLPLFANYVLMFDNIGKFGWRVRGCKQHSQMEIRNSLLTAFAILLHMLLGASLLARSLSWSKLFTNVIDWLAEVDQGSLS